MKWRVAKHMNRTIAGAMTVVGIVVLMAHSAFAALPPISDTSPNNSIIGNGAIWHNVIASNHGNVRDLVFAVDYPASVVGQKTITLVSGSTCSFNWLHDRPAGDGAGKVNTRGNLHMLVDYGTSNGNPSFNTYCKNGDWYATPSVLTPDLAGVGVSPTTGLKRVILRISANNISSVNGQGNGTAYNDASARFKIYAAGGQIGIIGSTDKNNSFVPTTGGDVTASYPFGLPCSGSPAGNYTLWLYDADNGNPGLQPKGSKLKFYINKYDANNNFVGRVGISNRQNTDILDNNVARPKDGTNVDAGVYLWMEPNAKYELVITDWSSYNFIYLGLPGDAIYGATNFTCPNYTLTPAVNISPAQVEAGEVFNVGGSVSYMGNVSAGNHRWLIREWKTSVDGVTIQRDIYDTTSAFPPNQNWSTAFTVPDADRPGTRYCYETYVLGWSLADGSWKGSGQMCTVVGIRPKLQIWGHDARVGRSIVASRPSYRDNKFYGSWAEYATFTGVETKQFMSGSALSGGGAPGANYTKLTFANVSDTGAAGNYGKYDTINYPTATVNALIRNFCNKDTSTWPTTFTPNDITGDKQVVCIKGNATINQDSDTPDRGYGKQSVIIATGNINIQKDVTTINAWLVAGAPLGENGTMDATKGTIDTCSNGPNTPVAGSCDTPLTVIGPLIANNLKLRRTTAPTADDPGKAAETFKTRTDAYIWASKGGMANSNAVARTTYVQELPPRF